MPAKAACTPASGTVVCSGTTTTTQTILVDQPTTITTTSGFSLDSAPGTIGISINGWGAGPITFDDQNASSITGDIDGINVQNPDNLASNTAVGPLSITTTGKVTGRTGIGIFVYHAGRLAGDLTINAVDVTGATYGIYTLNSGIGAATHITTTGTIEATSGTGLYALNSSPAAGLTVEAATVTGRDGGIMLGNQGAGATSLTVQTVTSTNGNAIYADNSGNATNLTIKAGTVSGGVAGIFATNYGSGFTDIAVTGTLTSTGGIGIYAANGTFGGPIATDLIINAVDIVAADRGIAAINQGAGQTSITTTGTVTAAGSTGIDALNGSLSKDLTIQTKAVTGGQDGIAATNLGSGFTSITADGAVEGTSGNGISTALNGSGDAQVTLTANGLAQGAAAGISVTTSGSDRAATIDNAGTIRNLSAASNAVAIGSQGDVSVAINNAALVTGTVALADGDDVFTNKGGAIWNTAGGTNEFGAGDNGVDNQSGARIVAGAAGAAAPAITRFNNVGTFTNGGEIAMQNGVVGDQTVIQGNYVGTGGTITLDTTLGTDGSPSDMLVIEGGTATGTTKLDIENGGGAGALTTSNGIMVVSTLDGATTESTAFSLSHAVAVNAYDYGLYYSSLSPSEDDQNWYLRSTGKLNPSSQTALPYADVLGNYAQATLGTLQQRTGNRIWPGGGARVAADLRASQAMAYAPGGAVIYGQGAWGRIGGQYSSYDPRSGSSYTQSIGFMQAGYEGVAFESASGDLTVGGYATLGTSSARIDTTRDPVTGALRARGKITTTGYGAGVNATWLGNDGFYADAIGQLTWYDSSLSNKPGGHNQGWSSALSLEVGKRFDLGSGWAVVPQVQLAWTHVDFDDFTDINGSPVSLGKGDSLRGRAGLRVENLSSWQDERGQTRRLQAYGIVNLTSEFLGGTSVEVAGASITQKNKRLWGEIGLGGNYAWNDQWSAYAEASYAAAISSRSGDNYAVKGTAGLRYRW
ncbi:hypothetical protein LMIY3S_03785 [Labrys miyagiensis]